MNGFTAGKVLIFIPLSDFCWLLLISNTQRKASESINKEMNTLHPAMQQQQLSQSFTRDAGPLWSPVAAFILIEFNSTLKSQHVSVFFTAKDKSQLVPVNHIKCFWSIFSLLPPSDKQDQRDRMVQSE